MSENIQQDIALDAAELRAKAKALRALTGLPEPYAAEAKALATRLEARVAFIVEQMKLAGVIDTYRTSARWAAGMTRKEKDTLRPFARSSLPSFEAAREALEAGR